MPAATTDTTALVRPPVKSSAKVVIEASPAKTNVSTKPTSEQETGQNTVEPWAEGGEFYPRIFADIEQAQSSLPPRSGILVKLKTKELNLTS